MSPEDVIFLRFSFAQPDSLPDVKQLGCHVVVIDIPFSLSVAPGEWPLSHPQTQRYYKRCLEERTLKFIRDLGERFVLWIDHHDHKGWTLVSEDDRFILKGGPKHPACALLVKPDIFIKYNLENVDTLVCHPDIDGLISAARFLLKGELPYQEALQDAVAADTRNVPLSPLGKILDMALKSKIDDVPTVLLSWLLYRGEDRAAFIKEAARSYQVKYESYSPISLSHRDVGKCRIVDFRCEVGPLPLTQVLCDLQVENRIGIVIYTRNGRNLIAVAGQDVNLPRILDLPGGTRSRVILDANHLSEVVERLMGEECLLH